nr:hypothetical protein CFP56_53764 [Quercus suber]
MFKPGINTMKTLAVTWLAHSPRSFINCKPPSSDRGDLSQGYGDPNLGEDSWNEVKEDLPSCFAFAINN